DSGKSALLEAISLTANGDTAGVVQLDKNVLTRSRFQRCCSYVSGRQRYPSYTTVRSFLFYTAAIKFGCSFSVEKLEKRLDKLMREFDLLEYCDEKLKDLSADVRRRALIAVALVKDPVLLVAEDPCHGLEPIACFHLMQCLHSYAAENNRIVLTSLMSPRSDICEMISGLTILFRGRVFYSGHIKNLPNYFRRVGLVCPDNENPAMYYLSKATINCKTPQTYEETQIRAMQLV
ncbi:hypothetical protein Angca_005369, partial [Angiostrongylus cantonensis]